MMYIFMIIFFSLSFCEEKLSLLDEVISLCQDQDDKNEGLIDEICEKNKENRFNETRDILNNDNNIKSVLDIDTQKKIKEKEQKKVVIDNVSDQEKTANLDRNFEIRNTPDLLENRNRDSVDLCLYKKSSCDLRLTNIEINRVDHRCFSEKLL